MPADDRSALPAGCREATDDDAEALIALVGAIFDEYPGCVLDLDDLDEDLRTPASVAAARGGPWWVVERDGEVVATVGAGPLTSDGTVELKRLYVARPQRRQGLGSELVDMVERHAAEQGATWIELWSDTRFADAHRRYTALGYTATGESRQLHDPSDTTELRFLKPVPRRTGS